MEISILGNLGFVDQVKDLRNYSNTQRFSSWVCMLDHFADGYVRNLSEEEYNIGNYIGAGEK